MDRLTAATLSADFVSLKHDSLGVIRSAEPLPWSFRMRPLVAISCALALMIPVSCLASASMPIPPGILPGADASISDLDFRYQLVGDPALRPLRVYNNSITTTIEFVQTPDAKPPVLQIDGAGKYLNSSVKYTQNPDRLIVDGLFDSAKLIYSGAKKGSVTIERLVKTGTSSKGLMLLPIKPEPQQTPRKAAELQVASSPSKVIGSAAVVPTTTTPPTVQAEGFTKPTSAISSASVQAAPATARLTTVSPKISITPPKPTPPPVPTWNVSPRDRTIREALKNWSTAAGWTFEPEYWTLPMDIPVTASATFTGDFKTAVRQLIAATELSDTPSQPCFYLNRVVRVVPINQVCDQMSAR